MNPSPVHSSLHPFRLIHQADYPILSDPITFRLDIHEEDETCGYSLPASSQHPR